MELTSWQHVATSVFFHYSRSTSCRAWMLDGEIPHRCLISISFRRHTWPLNHFPPPPTRSSSEIQQWP
ncbi:unnamed protein product [Staurois parvus]|uniref:Uncharacterized protein n=1 Tax=Staurois parvus TaxID=386267 RepID=A0ABN9C788_9NEOB|nr:unnamed protein product [Staurois parvus]